jgi:hypothetical protein
MAMLVERIPNIESTHKLSCWCVQRHEEDEERKKDCSK